MKKVSHKSMVLRIRMPVFVSFPILLFVSCFQPLLEEKISDYIPPVQNIQSSSFSCDNDDLLIITVSGSTLQPILNQEHFILTREDKLIPISNLFRCDSNCVLIGFSNPLPKNNEYRLIIKSDALLPGEFSKMVTIKPVSSGRISIFENTGFENTSINSLCYGDGKFIVAGDNGKMAYLPDSSTNWIEIKSGEGSDENKFIDAIYGISGGNNRFYAVGAGARILVSFNGLIWGRPMLRKYNDDSYYFVDDSFAGADIRCVTWGKGAGGRFIVAGEGGKLLFEWESGIWNDETVTLGEFNINTLIWGDTGGYGRFIAAGSGGNVYRSTSADGRPGIWVAAESQFDNLDVYSSAYGNGIFVIGGQNGSMAWSYDGDEWKKINNISDNDILDIAFGGGVFIAAGNGTLTKSQDGVFWEAITDNGFHPDDLISAVASDGRGKFIAAGNSPDDNKNKIVYWYQKP